MTTKSESPPANLAKQADPIVITQYQVLLGDINEAKRNAAAAKFDYAEKQGEKAARSYIWGLRLLKGRIDSARKDAKAWALNYGRAVDEKAKDLVSEIDALIHPHQAQLDAIAAAEARRVEAHRAVLNRAVDLGEVRFGATSAEIRLRMESLDGITLEGLEEFADQVAAAIVRSRAALTGMLAQAEAAEAQQRELEQRRAEEAEQQRLAEVARKEQEAQEERDRLAREAQEAAAAAAQPVLEEAERRVAEAEAKATPVHPTRAQVTGGPSPSTISEAAAMGWGWPGSLADCAVSPLGLPAAEVQGGAPSSSGFPWRTGFSTTSKKEVLTHQIYMAMAGLDREQVARAIAEGRLHDAITVDWERVR
jgi:hypothetical protein